MKLRSLVLALSLTGAAFAATSTWAADSAPQEVKNIVLVHGLFADASSWAKVIPLLQAKGLHVTAVQNPTTSLDDDVAAVNRALAQQDGPVILVGHSYGGMVISQAGDSEKVKGLVYIAARAPEAGEDYPALTKRFPAAPAGAGLQWSADGYGMLSENAFVNDFAGDLPKAEAETYYAVQQPIGVGIKTAKTTVAAWKDKPTWYAVSTQDRTINTEQQRFMAKRMNAHTVELDASHVSLISQPQAVAKLILQAAHVPGN
ncbi:alpha/beta hydrolase [Pseudomonas sp. S44]|nr:alpha/beta hydrolase [Pseudomonas putida]MBK0059114.1 alpha/beta hydrolase [Pseudomonas sp. S44]HEK1768556.1 alpha/beta hydrolase [Pseudomonas putida]